MSAARQGQIERTNVEGTRPAKASDVAAALGGGSGSLQGPAHLPLGRAEVSVLALALAKPSPRAPGAGAGSMLEREGGKTTHFGKYPAYLIFSGGLISDPVLRSPLLRIWILN